MHDQATLYKQYNYWQKQKGIDLIRQAKIGSNQQILDIGCGTGELTYAIAKEILPNGNVIAIDPDSARLTIAKTNQPCDIKNIVWHEKTIEAFSEIKPFTLDVAFANYTMHWVNDKEAALSNIRNVLKPDAMFIMNCIGEYSEIIADIASVSEEYNVIFKKSQIINKDAWKALLQKYDFNILEMKAVDDFIFDHLDDFLTFWEATSQGKFKRNMLSKKSYDFLLNKYPNKIYIFGSETFNVCVIK